MQNGLNTTNISDALESIGLHASDWEIDFSNPCGEGHAYRVQDKYYEDSSDLAVKNKYSGDVLDLWVGIAWVESMPKPIVFIKDIWPEELVPKYVKDLSLLNPEKQLNERLSIGELTELMQEEYFAEGGHIRLYNTSSFT